jgi:uncharacterized metal-binding protein YceD (DUF177 family)
MKIPIQEIPEDGTFLKGELAPKPYGLETTDSAEWEAIRYEFHLSRLNEQIMVTGRLAVRARLPCARCLEPISIPIEIPQFKRFYPVNDVDFIDLTADIREDILLGLPIAPRCELDEQGRCPYTGEMHRPSEDTFSELRRDEIWGALKNIAEK